MPGSIEALAGDAGGEVVELPVGGCVVVLQLARSLALSLSLSFGAGKERQSFYCIRYCRFSKKVMWKTKQNKKQGKMLEDVEKHLEVELMEKTRLKGAHHCAWVLYRSAG